MDGEGVKLSEIIYYINNNRFKLLKLGSLFFLGVNLYAALHEFVHYLAAIVQGYEPKIVWSFLMPPHVIFPGEPSFMQFFFIAFLPYISSMSLLIMLFILHKFINNKNKFLAKIAIFPCLDIFINILGLRVPGNDFQGIFLRAVNIWQISFVLFTIFTLIGLTIYFGQYFFRKLLNIV